jgi:hypothetical protein
MVMKRRRFVDSLTFRVSFEQRAAVEKIAADSEMSIGEAARELLIAGMKARGIEC